MLFWYTGPWPEDVEFLLSIPFVFWSEEDWADISREIAMGGGYVTVQDAERLFPNEWVVLDIRK